MSQINVDVNKLIAEGKTVEQIKDIIAVEIAKAQAAQVPSKTEIAARVIDGTVTTKDMIVLFIDYIKVQVPEIAELGDLDIKGEELAELAEIIDLSIEEGRKEVLPQIQLLKNLGINPKDMLGKDLTPQDAMGLLNKFKQTL